MMLTSKVSHCVQAAALKMLVIMCLQDLTMNQTSQHFPALPLLPSSPRPLRFKAGKGKRKVQRWGLFCRASVLAHER